MIKIDIEAQVEELAERLTPEQRYLMLLSSLTWHRRGAAKSANLPCNEETLTENLLLELALGYPGEVMIVPFTKSQEAKNGADWAWAFQSTDKSYLQPMLVQAKRLDNRERRYSGTKRYIQGTKPPVRQIDRLIETAARLRFPAIYVFYNHLHKDLRIPANCRSLSNLPRMVSAWGISLASAEAVRAKLKDETFTTHSKLSIPFHCLLCSMGQGRKGARGSAESANGAVAKLKSHDPKSSELDFAPDRRSGPWEGTPKLFELAEGAHRAIRAVEREAILRRLREEYPGVIGAVIFRDGKRELGSE